MVELRRSKICGERHSNSFEFKNWDESRSLWRLRLRWWSGTTANKDHNDDDGAVDGKSKINIQNFLNKYIFAHIAIDNMKGRRRKWQYFGFICSLTWLFYWLETFFRSLLFSSIFMLISNYFTFSISYNFCHNMNAERVHVVFINERDIHATSPAVH